MTHKSGYLVVPADLARLQRGLPGQDAGGSITSAKGVATAADGVQRTVTIAPTIN